MAFLTALILAASSLTSGPGIVDVLTVTAVDGTTTTNVIYWDGVVHGYVTLPDGTSFDFYGGTETF
jgi:hypothetical protein